MGSFYNCKLIPTYFFLGFNSLVPVVGSYFDPSDGVTYPVLNIAGTATKGSIGYIAGVAINGSDFTAFNGGMNQLIHTEVLSNPAVTATVKIRLMRYAPLPSTNTIPIQLNWINIIASDVSWTTSTGTNRTFGTTGTQTYTFSTSADPTCSVNTQNLQVNLPAIEAKQLSSDGATTGNTPFTLWVNCPSTTPVNVYMTLTDNSKPGQTNSTVVSAASGSSASGVGVQISDQNGLPITLGPDSSMAGNPGQFLVRSNLTGSIPIPFTANYIRTGAIKPGTLKAVATFTMSYQ